MLEVQNLSVSYGGIQAVRSISLEIKQGELVSLIGANVAGKTTTLKSICGLIPITSGQVLYQGEPLCHNTFLLASKGIALVPEGRGVFKGLTVLENLKMGAFHRKDTNCISKDLNNIYELFPLLYERQTQQAATLSGGEQQMMVIARAMMSRPKLLLLDEPSMGLAPLMTDKIFNIIKKIAREGMTVLLVEQNAKLALEMSNRAYVMDSGEMVLTGDAHDLLKNPKIKQAYLGEWTEDTGGHESAFV